MAFALASSAQLAFLIDWDSDSSDEEDLVDYRTLPRSTHRSFGHDCARYCIMRDWLGEGCLFFESEFKRCFMESRARFEMISQRLVASDPKFYTENCSANKEPVASGAT
jgi:hypothetical protein